MGSTANEDLPVWHKTDPGRETKREIDLILLEIARDRGNDRSQVDTVGKFQRRRFLEAERAHSQCADWFMAMTKGFQAPWEKILSDGTFRSWVCLCSVKLFKKQWHPNGTALAWRHACTKYYDSAEDGFGNVSRLHELSEGAQRVRRFWRKEKKSITSDCTSNLFIKTFSHAYSLLANRLRHLSQFSRPSPTGPTPSPAPT